MFNKKNNYMSKIEELKKQNPNLNINLIDIINNVVPKTKYTEMIVNIIKYRFNKIENRGVLLEYPSIHENNNILINSFNLSPSWVETLSYFESKFISTILLDIVGMDNFKIVEKFIDLNERKLVENKDLTTYKSFEELDLQNSLTDLKIVDHELKKQIQILHETDEWLLLKPLSFQSSLKYGSNTKWCTSSNNNPEYYYRYSKRGILIYAINKKTGNKVGAFKNIDTGYDKELSFWNNLDMKIDSIESGLPDFILNLIKDDFLTTNKTNWDILSDDEKNRQMYWLENEFYGKIVTNKTNFTEPMEERIDESYEPIEERID